MMNDHYHCTEDQYCRSTYYGREEEDDPSEMTYSRRAARYLSQFSWYNPSVHSDKEGGPSLDAAWSHYEHVTLARRFVLDDSYTNTGSSSNKDNQNLFVRAPQSQRSLYKTRLYPVWDTPLQELVHFGVSIRMFFATLLVFSGILGVAGLLNIPLMVYFWGYANHQDHNNNNNNKDGVDYMGVGKMIRASALCDATEWVECSTCADNIDEFPSYRLDTTSNNDDNWNVYVRRNDCNFEGFLSPGICSFTATLLILILTAFFVFRKQRQAEIVFDEQIQTASDYSIKISNPPADALDPEEWRSFFNQFVEKRQQAPSNSSPAPVGDTVREHKNDKEQRGAARGVVLVTIAINNAQLLKALIERRKKLQALSKLLPHGTDMTNESLLQMAVEDISAASSSSLVTRSILALSKQLQVLRILQQDPQQLWNDIQNLEHQIRSLVLEPRERFQAIAVFVTFDTERSQRNALHALSTGKLQVWRNQLDRHRCKGGRLMVRESNQSSTLWDCHDAVQEEWIIQLRMMPTARTTTTSSEESEPTSSCSQALLFRGTHVLRIKEAVEPNDVRWVDLQASTRQRLELYMASTLGMALFIMCSGYVIYFLAKNYPGQYAAIFITGVSRAQYIWVHDDEEGYSFS
jgi:hypothetical protein